MKGNNLKEERKKAGISQSELSRRTKVPRPTICCLENGTFPMTLALAKRLAPALGCAPEALIGNENIRFAPILQLKRKGPIPFSEALAGFAMNYGKGFHRNQEETFVDVPSQVLRAALLRGLTTDPETYASFLALLAHWTEGEPRK